MASKFQIKRELTACFIIEKETLERIFKHLTNTTTGETPSVHTTFKNGRVVIVQDIEELFADSLTSAEEIKEVDIYAPNLDGCRASVGIAWYRVRCDVSGERGKAISLEESIVHELNSAITWYSWRRNRFVFPLFLTIAIVQIFVAIIGGISFLKSDQGHIYGNFITPISFIFTAIIFSEMAFPNVIFNIGLSARKHKRRSSIFTFFFIVIFFGILVGVAGNFFSKLIGI